MTCIVSGWQDCTCGRDSFSQIRIPNTGASFVGAVRDKCAVDSATPGLGESDTSLSMSRVRESNAVDEVNDAATVRIEIVAGDAGVIRAYV